MTDSPAAPVVTFFKKGKTRPTTTRKRVASAEPEPATEVIQPAKKPGATVLSQGTKRSRPVDDDEPAAERGLDVHWSASAQQTAVDILAGDAAEELERKRMRTDDTPVEHADDGLYHGMKAYGNKIRADREVPKSMRVGPQRMSGQSTIRTVTMIDYQPDVCKDYKETGYCGFGDTCKFLHDRGTYLAGWQLDQLAAKPRPAAGDESDDDSDSDEDLPFACYICKKPFTDPIVTRCGHYFDSACAIKRFSKTPKCLACGANTGGIFNRAEKILKRMKKVDEAAANEAGDAEEASASNVQLEGLETNDEDEDDD